MIAGFDNRISVTHILEATIGGTRRHLFQLADHIDRARFKLSFILSPTRFPLSVEKDALALREMGFEVYNVNMEREISPIRDLRSWWSLYRLLCLIGPQIVHTHASKAGILGRSAARAAGVQYCFHTPHLWAFDWEKNPALRNFYIAIERVTAAITDEIVTVSLHQAKEANRLSVAPKAKTIPIRNTVEHRPIEPDVQPDRPFTIGTCGRLARQKGHSFLLEAYATFAASCPNSRLLICGDGPLLSELRTRTDILGLGDNVKFLGHVADVFSFLSNIDLFVLPSHWEGLPYTLLEAMSVGKPVIASDVNGIDEVLFDGWNGWLVPAGNSTQLAAAIQHAFDNPVQRRECGANARESLADYEVSDFVKILEWRYLSAVRKRPIFHG